MRNIGPQLSWCEIKVFDPPTWHSHMGVGTWSNTVSCLVLQSVAFIVFAICIVEDLRYRRGISVEIEFKMHLQYFIISLLYNKICLDILYWSTGCRLYCIFAVFCDARFFTKECIAKIAVIQFHTLQQLHKSFGIITFRVFVLAVFIVQTNMLQGH